MQMYRPMAVRMRFRRGRGENECARVRRFTPHARSSLSSGARRHEDDQQQGELSTPVVTDKVDPAYPADLIRDQVEGIVILYAVIHADGTVGDVRVLQGVQEKLDASVRRKVHG